MTTAGRFLVIDDSAMNRVILQHALEDQGHSVLLAENGRAGMETLRGEPVDVVLLDIEMPEMDGYEVLAAVKADSALRDLPVIVISAVGDMDSVIRCVEMGATDYLPKPFDPALLQARINSSLAARRLRELELQYLEEVGHVVGAATALEAGTFVPGSLDSVASRDDALGGLARVFSQMAAEVQAREERLKRRVAELTIEIDQARQNQRVAEITDTEYFANLRSRAADLRGIIDRED